jgi:hypothetical protein
MMDWDTPKQLPVVDKSAAAIGGSFSARNRSSRQTGEGPL